MGIRGLDKGERPALLINECQNGMVDVDHAGPGGLAGEVARRHVLTSIARLAEACRALRIPVLHSTIVPRRDYAGTTTNALLLGALVKKGQVVEGRPEAEIHPLLQPQPGDIHLNRVHGLSPFHATELEPVLRQQQVQTLIVTGVSTHVGIPGACLEAVNRGFTAVVPEDCVAGAWPEAHDAQMQHNMPLIATVTDLEAVLAQLAAAGP
ncbi:MAG: hypothetical protein JWL64_2390 [Frankiales bacterium]|nr:hypothetical protein [Frankiales bacterium]